MRQPSCPLFRAAPLTMALAASALGSPCRAQTNLDLTFNWVDRNGRVHPASNLLTSVGAYNSIFPDWDLGDRYLDENGTTRASMALGIRIAEGFRGWLYAIAGNSTEGVWVRVENAAGEAYAVPWPASGYVVVDRGQTATRSFRYNTTNEAARALGMTQVITFMHNFYNGTLGLAVNPITLRYDPSYTGESSSYSGPEQRIRVRADNWGAYDVITHEYGHHIATQYGLIEIPAYNGPGTTPETWLGHSFGSSAIRGRDAEAGVRIGWYEGLATYLGLSAGVEGSLRGQPNFNGISNLEGDDTYHHFRSKGSRAAYPQDLYFSMSAETNLFIDNDAARRTFLAEARDGAGEGDESSVLHVLWDLFDSTNENVRYTPVPGTNRVTTTSWRWGSDRVTWGAQRVWNQVLRGHGGDGVPNVCFEWAWHDITANLNTAEGRQGISGLATNTRWEATAAIGEILGENGISGIPRGVFGTSTGDVIFNWYAQNGGCSQYERILVFSADWSGIVLDSGAFGLGRLFQFMIGEDHTWTSPTRLAPGDYFWVILNNPALYNAGNNPPDGLLPSEYQGYWSGAQPFTVVPASPTLALAGLAALCAPRRRRR